MKHPNTLFILSDQHNPAVTGCYGNSYARTPNLDRIAENGIRFENAFCNSPLCCPSRASMLTGRYVHDGGWWDNAFPFQGEAEGWNAKIRARGHRVDAIGKLHFRSAGDDNGFSHEHNTLHTVEGGGDVLGCIRDNPLLFDKRTGVENAGVGSSSYLDYDAANAKQASKWILNHKDDDEPWILFLGFALPHPPNIVPPEFFDPYRRSDIPLPAQGERESWPNHPAMEYVRKYFKFEEPIDESHRRDFLAAYYGACSYVDHQIGLVLDALRSANIADKTQIIYASDHGEDMGARGIFGKFHLYEEAVKVPLIISHPDLPSYKVIDTPVSLVDLYPTMLSAYGMADDGAELAGRSLYEIAEGNHKNREVFAEYHGPGSRNAMYSLRNSLYKFIYHVDQPPQLFSMKTDQDELHDLSGKEDFSALLADFETRLRKEVDPEDIDTRAKEAQAMRVEAAGGKEAVISKGTFDNSPIPGEAPIFFRRS